MGWIDRITGMLDQTDWGADFSLDEIKTIARHLVIRHYESGSYIFHENDPENYMAFIIQGSVSIKKSNDPEKSVTNLVRGTHFGELSLIDEMPRSASAVAIEDTTLLVMQKEDFQMLLADHPRLGVKMVLNIARLISKRLRETTDELVYLKT